MLLSKQLSLSSNDILIPFFFKDKKCKQKINSFLTFCIWFVHVVIRHKLQERLEYLVSKNNALAALDRKINRKKQKEVATKWS